MRSTEKETGLGAVGDGLVSILCIAFSRCFLPMYPLGHNVSEISSTGMTRGFVIVEKSENVTSLLWVLAVLFQFVMFLNRPPLFVEARKVMRRMIYSMVVLCVMMLCRLALHTYRVYGVCMVVYGMILVWYDVQCTLQYCDNHSSPAVEVINQ